MISSDFRTEARRRLSGKWGKAVCIVLAYLVTFFAIGFITGIFPDSLESLLSIATIIIEIPLTFGLLFAFLKLFNGEDVKAFDFIKLSIDNFKRSWGVTFRIFLKMLLPIILVIISYALIIGGSISIYTSAASIISGSGADSSFGILAILGFILLIISLVWATIKSYSYQLANLIAMENPELSAADAVLKSEELMNGKRGKLFVLQLSFIGWIILAAIPFYIGFLWLLPYVQMAIIAFYKFAIGDTSVVNNDPIQ